MFQLDRKTAYVTGGNGLIGRAICSALADAGASVFSLDLVEQHGMDARVRQSVFDAADMINLEGRLETLENMHGHADVWVNAAYPRTTEFGTNQQDDLDEADWCKNVDLQMNAACLLSAKVATRMGARGHGSIINLASIYGLRGPDLRVYDGLEMPLSPPVYSAIKGGLINYGRYLAAWYGPKGVRVNTVCPGGIEDGQPENFIAQYAERTPMRRMGNPNDVAGPVVFLASDAAAYVNGVALPVDGGWTAV
ncbi:SDR family oxidoreductase [Aestuariispira insulae]|uniref:NAD(P)-dependent dehydrogenase (Short-subunit alcohol dehydrogenase family) n=1 Tax=Aestuariispira insulae TaxID=1461337 RepID=A0A3D9H9M0_9PROT|nr:SDR family oxidoreductase [Aestuariispira insulae]RED46178.1 NAD(P)-dependent dehydrogenase (short-subunit alcohol dehydrogenase family) [Aestuariispira insulae]